MFSIHKRRENEILFVFRLNKRKRLAEGATESGFKLCFDVGASTNLHIDL